MVNLGFAQIYLKLMIDGVSSQPFSATTLPPVVKPAIDFSKEIIAESRKNFAHPRAEVEKNIITWHEAVKVPPKDSQASRGNFEQGGGVGKAVLPSQNNNLTGHTANATNAKTFDKGGFQNRDSGRTAGVGGQNFGQNKTQGYAPKQATVSFADLKKAMPFQKKPDADGAGGKNQLREALSQVLKEKEKEKITQSFGANSGQKFDGKIKPEPVSPPVQNSPKEVPEDVLKKVLAVNEEPNKNPN
jgi:hypothetical protein